MRSANAAGVLVLSEYSRSLLLGAHPGVEERVFRVTGGIDPAAFGPGLDRAEARRRVGVEPDRHLIVSVRRLDPRMGLEQLLHASAILRAQGLDFTLAVAGDGILAGRLRRLAADLGLDSSVRFLGRVGEERLKDLYVAADLAALPTVAYEGFGMSTIEALACGTPVVGTAVGATPELLEPLDPGLVVASAEPQALAAAIARTLESTDVTFRERCASYARSRYAWDRAILAWEAAFEQLALQGPLHRST